MKDLLAWAGKNQANKLEDVINDAKNPTFWESIDWSDILKKFAFALIIFIIGYYVLKVINLLIRKIMNRHNINKGLTHFLIKFFSFFYLFVLFTIIAGNLGFKITSLITLIGSLGLAIGLAMQGSLQDLASGILIVTLNNFRVGDYVYVGENDNLLKVYSINLFNSLFRNSSNYIVSFPNSYLTKNKITNLSTLDYVYCSYYFHVPGDVDVELIKTLCKEVLDKEELIIHDQDYLIKISEITDYSLKFLMSGQVKAKDLLACQGNLLEGMRLAFKDHGIKVPHQKFIISNEE